MRSNQLSYLAIALKASAKIGIIFIFANFFATFFKLFLKMGHSNQFRTPHDHKFDKNLHLVLLNYTCPVTSNVVAQAIVSIKLHGVSTVAILDKLCCTAFKHSIVCKACHIILIHM